MNEKCLNKNDLILYYYQALKGSQYKNVESHLAKCSHCAQDYERIKHLCREMTGSEIKLSEQDIQGMINAVLEKTQSYGFLAGLKDNLKKFLSDVWLGLSYRPQLVPALVVLIVLLGIVPLISKNRLSVERKVVVEKDAVVDREIAILEIEMELSLESEEDIFDSFESESISKIEHYKKFAV